MFFGQIGHPRKMIHESQGAIVYDTYLVTGVGPFQELPHEVRILRGYLEKSLLGE